MYFGKNTEFMNVKPGDTYSNVSTVKAENHKEIRPIGAAMTRRQFQNQPPIGWLKKHKIENKTLLYGTVTYITALLLHIVATHIQATVVP
jgi:hypothetical protein